MGVTYRYMGTSHSLGVDKETLIFFLYPFFLYFADGSIENRHSSNGARPAKPQEQGYLILNPMLGCMRDELYMSKIPLYQIFKDNNLKDKWCIR